MSSDLFVPAPASVAEFVSLLFQAPETVPADRPEPAYFRDLNLDQLVASLVAGREEYRLAPYFYTPLTSPETVQYRHEVLRDLQDTQIERAVTSFAAGMTAARDQLRQAEKLHYPVQQQDTHLRAAATYVRAVGDLTVALSEGSPTSRGLSAFARYLRGYVSSTSFEALSTQSSAVRGGLDQVAYRLHLPGGRVSVSRDLSEEDYTADVADTFARFRQGSVDSHLTKIPTYPEINQVEAAIADLVAQLYPDQFAALRTFRERHPDFLDPTVQVVDREVQFYLAYLQFANKLQAAGLPLCYPQVSTSDTQIRAVDAFDAALADHLIAESKPVVGNDFRLDRPERIIVISGPNQGGKTTFARMLGQLSYLASLGLLVPGRQARLPLPDQILTHFERGENLQDLTGALQDDLVRIRDILHTATERSLVIVNEIFTSTSPEDAVLLSTRVLRQVIRLGCLCVCVTFLDELATLDDSTVSMVSQVDPQDPATRTFKVLRQPGAGAAYAQAIAEKYRLDYPSLKARLPR